VVLYYPIADVKTLFKRFVAIQGYQGTVNVGSNGKPGMAPSDIDSLRKKSEELGQKLDELTDKMEERIAVQSQAFVSLIRSVAIILQSTVVLLWCLIRRLGNIREKNTSRQPSN
jgi:hypothetical protein